MCCYPGVAYKELLRDWHVLCAFLGCLLPHLQHGLPHCGKGFGDPASLASAAPVHTCSRSESIDSKSVSASYVKVICNLQGCSASLSTFTVATDSFLWKHRDELVCIRLQLGLSCFGIAVQLATQVALMHYSGCTGVGSGASQGELTRLGETTGLPAMVGATSVKVQHFASTRSDTP